MNSYDIERYEKIHVWVGVNFSSEDDYLKYFELDYSVDLDDPDEILVIPSHTNISAKPTNLVCRIIQIHRIVQLEIL